MRTQRSWPHRFKVVVRTAPDTAVPYSVVTWLAEEKAIALAVTAHLRRHHEPNGIHDVEVEDLGPVGRDAQGEMMLERNDLVDRAEF